MHALQLVGESDEAFAKRAERGGHHARMLPAVFRARLKGLDHSVEDLADNAFQGIEAFRQTGIRTKLLSLSKPSS